MKKIVVCLILLSFVFIVHETLAEDREVLHMRMSAGGMSSAEYTTEEMGMMADITYLVVAGDRGL